MKVEDKGRKKVVSFRWSIGTKVTILILAMVIIPMSAISYYNLSESQDEISKIARDNLIELSWGTSCQIEQLLIENQRTSATLAGESIVVQFLTASEEERQGLEPQLYETLQNYADTHPDYDAPGILDVNGIVVASLDEQLMGRNRSFRDYFQASIQGESYVSGILVGRATGRPGVFLTNPVITVEREIVGINIVWLKGNTIWDIIDNVVIGGEGIAYLLDSDGVIIAHPDRDLLYHSLGELTPEAKEEINSTIRFGTINGTNTSLIPESLGMGDLADELASTEGSGSFLFRSPLDNRDHVVGYTPLEECSLTVIVDLPKEQFMAPLQRLESIAWLSVWLVIVIVLIISVLLVRGITHPIRHLANTAMAVVEGSQPFDPSDIEDVTLGHDEIAHLGRVFSDMVVSLQQELTKRKHSEGKIKDILESSPDAITVTDLQGTITECNEATLRVHNFSSKEEIIGKNAFTLFPKREQKRATENLKKTLKEGSVKNIEYTLLKKDGKEFPVEMSASTINDISRKPVAFVAITKDITEREKAENALKKAYDELEVNVAKRTDELTQANIKLQELDRLKSMFMASMSHELRTPLNSIIGFTGIILQGITGEITEEQQKQLTMVKNSADHLLALINDVIDMSKIETGKVELTIDKFDLSNIVQDITDSSKIVVAEKDIKMSLEVPKRVVIRSDERMAKQVIMNLVSNAMKFTDEGEIKIKVVKKDGRVEVLVRDTGIGIKKEQMKELFKAFSQVHDKERPLQEGTGLGLYLSKKIADLLGGEIKVESEFGKGSVFTFILPLKYKEVKT